MSLFRRCASTCPTCGKAARRDLGERKAGPRVRKVDMRCSACAATWRADLPGDWWILWRDLAGRVRRQLIGADIAGARACEGKLLAARREGRILNPRTKCKTNLGEAVALYLRAIEGTRKGRGFYSVKVRLGQLSKALGAGRRLDTIQEADLEAYRRARTAEKGRDGKGIKAATINRDLATLGALLSWAVKEGKIERRPKIAMPPERNQRTRFLTREEVGRLLASCEPHVADLVRAAVSTGCRLGELCALEWSWVDLARGIVSLPGSACKSGKGRHIPINATFGALLAERKTKARPDCPLVFHLDGRVPKSVWYAFKKAAKAAKLPDLHFHDLRHSFASWLVQGGTDLYSVSTLLGHATLAMSARYAHLEPGHLRGAVAKAELYLDPTPPPEDTAPVESAPKEAPRPKSVPSLIPGKIIPFENPKAEAC